MLQPEAAVLRRKILGVMLRHARLRANLSLKEVARRTGFSNTAISDFEYGRRDLTLPQLEVVAYLYGVPVSYFWSEDALVEDEERALPVEQAMTLRRRIIGVLLRQARLEANVSMNRLAEVLDCPPARISNYEAGRIDIPLHELERLAELLGVPLTYFFDQGIKPDSAHTATIDEVKQLAQLPEEVRRFVFHPGNLLYLRLAMQLSSLPASTLRRLGEGLLEITY